MKPSRPSRLGYTDTDVAAAVRASTSIGQVLRRLGLKVAGGSSSSVRRRIQHLGLDTSHFSRKGVGRTRKRVSFCCKHCGRVVSLKQGEVPKVYCSPDCLREGRAASLKAAFSVPAIREQISATQTRNWAENRESRLESFEAAAPQRRRAAMQAAQSPELRATRSRNARARWDADPEWAQKFLAAGKQNRRDRALQGLIPRRPHVPFESKNGLVMLRSKWERDFALWLDRQGLAWKYEPLRVVVAGRPYTPDFWVRSPFGPCYVETHRVATAMAGDMKLAKMEAARPHLDAPLVLVSEDGINAIRRALRQPV